LLPLLVVDEGGRLLFHNARLREIVGYNKEELDFCDSRFRRGEDVSPVVAILVETVFTYLTAACRVSWIPSADIPATPRRCLPQ
jgi:hypothetical protein